MRTSEITRIQRASHPSAGIPPAFSDNRTGRKECAGCRSRPGGNERQDSYIGDIRRTVGVVSRGEEEMPLR